MTVVAMVPYKFILVSVVQEIDEEGTVVGERTSDEVTVFGLHGLVKFAENFHMLIPDVGGNENGARL
jgi:hypothetical protein